MSSRTLFRTLGSIGLAVAANLGSLAGFAAAQAPVVVTGRVLLPDSTPAANATVSIRGTAIATTTDDAGTFRLANVPPGDHVLEAVLAGYRPGGTAVTVPARGMADVDVRLGPVSLAGERVDVLGDRRDTDVMKAPGPLIELPYSVSVIPRRRIEQQKAQSLNEVLRYTAGVQSEQYGGLDQAFDFLTIRGFGGSYLDGVFRDGAQLYTFGFNGFRIEPYGAEAIEVLRGSTSVLYGQTSPGGMINVVSKRPTRTPLREVTFEAGSFDHLQAKFDFSGPAGGGGTSLGYRLTGVVRNSATQVDFQDNDRIFLAPALSWSGRRTTLTVLGHYQRDSTQHFQFLPQRGTAEPTANGRIPANRADGEPAFDKFDRRQYSAGYLLEHRWSSGWTMRQNTRYDHVGVDYTDVFGTGLDPDDPSERTMSRGTFTILGSSDVVTADLQAQRTFAHGDVRNTLLVGGEHQYSIFDSVDGFGAAPPLDVYTPVYGAPVDRPEPYADARTTRHRTGFYVHDRLHLPSGLVAMFSGRQNFVSDAVEDRLAGATSDEDAHKFVWQGGLAYVTRPGLVPYVSYSESFLPVSGSDTSGTRFVPETGRQFEGGLRHQARDGRASVAGALFHLRRQNVFTPDPANPANQIQTGEVRSRGVELEAEASPIGRLSVIASYTYQDVEITRSEAGNQGMRPSVIPAHMASAWLHNEWSGRLRGFGAGLGVRYQGATLDATNELEVVGFTLVDAVASYSMRRLRFTLNAQNLFDKDFVAGCSDGTCYYGRTRTIYAGTTYRW